MRRWERGRRVSGGRLRVLREARELTQQAAAEAFGVSLRTWTLWEKSGPSRMGEMMLEREGWV